MNKLIPHASNLCSRNAEKMISIKLNNHCNMHCAFCVDRGGHNGGMIDVEKIATEALAFPAYKTVIITGGEPFLNFDKVLELTSKLRADKKRLVLNTNGSLLTPQKVCRLNTLIDELQISIHHFDESVNARVFGKVISFENIKKSIEGKKFTVSINSTLTIPTHKMTCRQLF